MAAEEPRAGLRGARRLVIKAGTSVVSTPEGYPSLVRLANIVEQVGGGVGACGGLGLVGIAVDWDGGWC